MFRAIGWERMVRQQSMGTSETELYLYGGNHPENVDPAHGTTIATKYIITCNGGKVIVNLCFEIKGAVSE